MKGIRTEDAEGILLSLIDGAMRLGAAGVDAIFDMSRSFSVSLCDGEPEEDAAGEEKSIGLRFVDADGRQGVVATNDFAKDTLSALPEWGMRNCRAGDADPWVRLPDVAVFRSAGDPGDLMLVDERIPSLARKDRVDACVRMTDAARSVPPLRGVRVCSVRSAEWNDWESARCYATSTGILGWSRMTGVSLGTTVVLDDGLTRNMGGYDAQSHRLDAVDPCATAREAVRRTALTFGGRAVAKGRYDLVLDVPVVADLLDVLGDLFLSSSVHRKQSFLAGKIGEPVAGRELSLVDDGRLAGGMGTAPFDDEGVPTSRTSLLDRGILTGYLYDLRNAAEDGVSSTGNACRSVCSPPDVSASNLLMGPGRRSREDLVASVGKGILVTELMGLHTVDPVSGDYSLGIRGVLLRGGETGAPISGMTMAGTLQDLLLRVDGVADDLTLRGNVGACTMVVRDVMVAGD
jgi:PmbA protein